MFTHDAGYCAAAAAAKALSRVRLCDPMDGSPPGSPVPGLLQAGAPWAPPPSPTVPLAHP